MIVENSALDSDPAALEARIDGIVRAGPKGAFALAGAAVAVVIAIWWAFYLLIYLTRGA